MKRVVVMTLNVDSYKFLKYTVTQTKLNGRKEPKI